MTGIGKKEKWAMLLTTAAKKCTHNPLSPQAQTDSTAAIVPNSPAPNVSVGRSLSNYSLQPIQRQPDEEFEAPKAPDPNALPGYKAGDGWHGWKDPFRYGAFAGPGNVPGSVSGIDGMDEAARQHDANYGRVGVSADSMWSPGSIMKSRKADRLLVDEVTQEMQNNGGQYSSSARLYGQGIKGIFGARATAGDGLQWGSDKVDDVETGVTNTWNKASDFASRKANDVTSGVSDSINQAGNWGGKKEEDVVSGVSDSVKQAGGFLGNKEDEASNGLSDFANQASSWNSVGDAAQGVGSGVKQAVNWATQTGNQAIDGVTGAATDATQWAVKTGGEAVQGVGSGVKKAVNWARQTGNEAIDGTIGAAKDATQWAAKTGSEAVQGVSSAVSGAKSWASDTVDEGAKAVGGLLKDLF